MLNHAAGTAGAFISLLAGSALAVTIATVPVGDPGNMADHSGSPPGVGSVGYAYSIAKYEVTAGQYCEFLNAVARTDMYALYNTNMWSTSAGCKIQRSGVSGDYVYSVADDYANRPVNWVSFWDACRFTNWLHNGQPVGSQTAGMTETGAYALDGYNGLDGRTIQRNAGATWVVPRENEWYKAAYYKAGSNDAGYWTYATRRNGAPQQDINDLSGNNANYKHEWSSPVPIQPPYFTTVVGQFQNSFSAYGTFDQSGNVAEWNETITRELSTFVHHGQRGGAYFDGIPAISSWGGSGGNTPSSDSAGYGFRVVLLPEPTTLLLLCIGAVFSSPTRTRQLIARQIARDTYMSPSR